METMEVNIWDVIKIAGSLLTTVTGALIYLYMVHRRDYKRNSIQVSDLYKQYLEEQKQNVEKMTKVVSDNRYAVERLNDSVAQNTRMVDKLFEKINKR